MKKKIILILFSSLYLHSCQTVFIPEQIASQFYVEHSEGLLGMQLRNELISEFPNRDSNTSTYKIQTKIEQLETVFLTSAAGFATKANAIAVLTVSLLNAKNNKVLTTYTKHYTEVYNIAFSGFNSKNNKEYAYNTLVMRMVNDIYNYIFTYLAVSKK